MAKVIMKYQVQLVRESAKRYEVTTKVLDTSVKARRFLVELLDVEKWHNEKFGMVCMDVQQNVIGYHIVFEGSVSETPVMVREVVTRALLNNCSSVLLFHNHPGTSLKPSKADVDVTRKIKEALQLLEIKLLDHVILVEDKKSMSMAEEGYL